jgi:hypothetical protein
MYKKIKKITPEKEASFAAERWTRILPDRVYVLKCE